MRGIFASLGHWTWTVASSVAFFIIFQTHKQYLSGLHGCLWHLLALVVMRGPERMWMGCFGMPQLWWLQHILLWDVSQQSGHLTGCGSLQWIKQSCLAHNTHSHICRHPLQEKPHEVVAQSACPSAFVTAIVFLLLLCWTWNDSQSFRPLISSSPGVGFMAFFTTKFRVCVMQFVWQRFRLLAHAYNLAAASVKRPHTMFWMPHSSIRAVFTSQSL